MAMYRRHGSKKFNKKWNITREDFNSIVSCEDHTKEIVEALGTAMVRGLEKCGLVAEGYAKKLCPVDTGRLRNSITFDISEDENAVYIGTNVEYAVYVETGTGKHADGGGGRPTKWVYKDANGEIHYTGGDRAKPFLRPAVAAHAATYRKIMEAEMKGK